jgi:hypothetical protein
MERTPPAAATTASARPASRQIPVPECPPGWQTGPPDFVGVGAHRSGTTWMYQMLVAHPDVAVPPERQKEIHFFEVFWEGGFTEQEVARYHSYFPRPAGKLVGEWTPRYMVDTWAPRMLAAAAPGARLLVLLRDPVARYVSHLGTHLSRGAARATRGPAVSSVALARSLYCPQPHGVLRHFPRDRLLVQQFERCMLEPEREVRRAYEFLGLDPRFVPADITRQVNTGGSIELEPAMLEDVAAVLRPDAEELARRFPEIDLSLWPAVQDPTTVRAR